MTKAHPRHRKKAIHMVFRRSPRVRRLFWHVSGLLDMIKRPKRKARSEVYEH